MIVQIITTAYISAPTDFMRADSSPSGRLCGPSRCARSLHVQIARSGSFPFYLDYMYIY